MYSINDVRRGLKIEINGEPYEVIEFENVKPGKGSAFLRTKLKSLVDGTILDRTFKSYEKIPKPDVIQKTMQYLYKEGDNYCFMDNETYEQVLIPKNIMGDAVKFLKENTNVEVIIYNQKPIGIELPKFVDLKVVETPPGVKGDTATGGGKPATLETGAVVIVPLFIGVDEVIRIDTENGEYVERVKK